MCTKEFTEIFGVVTTMELLELLSLIQVTISKEENKYIVSNGLNQTQFKNEKLVKALYQSAIDTYKQLTENEQQNMLQCLQDIIHDKRR